MTTTDASRAKAFLERMTGIMNGGALSLMCSIGHRTGLFDVLAGLPPLTTTAEIAEARRAAGALRAGVARRAIVWARSSTTTPRPAPTSCPPSTPGCSPGRPAPLNLTTFCQYVPLLGAVEDEVVEAFRDGGGVPYDRYPDFQRLMAESSGQRVRADPRRAQVVPLAARRRRRACRRASTWPTWAAAAARALNLLAADVPRQPLHRLRHLRDRRRQRARGEAEDPASTTCAFEVRDAAALDEESAFDVVTQLRRRPRPGPTPRRARRASTGRSGRAAPTCAWSRKASSHLHDNVDLPLGAAAVHGVHHALHDGVAGLRRRGPRCGVGRGRRLAGSLGEAGFTDIEQTVDPRRPRQQLLPGPQALSDAGARPAPELPAQWTALSDSPATASALRLASSRS